MKINIGDYSITSDNLQFIVSRKNIVKEGVFTKEENIGKEVYKPIAYCCKFQEALSYIPNDVLKTNDDINIIKDKLDQIKADIEQIKEYPVIVVKEEPKVKIEESEGEEENE